MKANIKPSDTLHLVLKRKWYDMIASGEKTEEYREIKPYWSNRLMWEIDGFCGFNSYKYICFSKGYTKTRMTFESAGININYGKPEWGAPTDRNVFIIKLGKRIK